MEPPTTQNDTNFKKIKISAGIIFSNPNWSVTGDGGFKFANIQGMALNHLGYVLEGKKYDGSTGSGIKGQILLYTHPSPMVYSGGEDSGGNELTPAFTYNVNSFAALTGSGYGDYEFICDENIDASIVSGTTFYIDFKIDSSLLTK